MQIKKAPRDGQYPESARFENRDYEANTNERFNDGASQGFDVRPARPSGAQPGARDESSDRPTAAARSESVIDRHSSFDGRFETDHDLKVEGTISGEIVCRGTFTVEKEATARARVQARDAHVQGRLEGDIVCSGKLLLSSTAHVTGTFKAAVLVVEEGAAVSGTVETSQANSSPRELPARPAPAENGAAKEPGTVTRGNRRDLPSFAIVASDDRAAN